MSFTPIARRAKVPHNCESCYPYGQIKPGDIYLEHVAAPGMYDLEGWMRTAECRECAERYGRGDLIKARET